MSEMDEETEEFVSEEQQDTTVTETEVTEEEVNEAEFTDTETDGGEETATEDAHPQKSVLSKEDRARYAQRRREKESRELEEIKRQAKFDGIKDALGGKNPYTGKDIVDDVDMQVYLNMREIENEGGDPVMDYAEHVAKKSRETAKAATESAQTGEWYAKDGKEFLKAHPELGESGMEELMQDKTFSAFAEKMVGKVSLNDIYDAYNTMRNAIDGEAKQKAQRMYAKKLSTPSSLGGSGDYKPKKSIADLTSEEMEDAIAKVKRGEKIF